MVCLIVLTSKSVPASTRLEDPSRKGTTRTAKSAPFNPCPSREGPYSNTACLRHHRSDRTQQNNRCSECDISTMRMWITMECSQPAALTCYDHFWLDPTQRCASGKRCDRVSSVSSHRTREVLQHLLTRYQHFLALPAYLPTTTSITAPTKPTIAMPNYIHTKTVINSSALHVQPKRF